MKKISTVIVSIVFIALSSFARQLPLNTCGIVNVYDAAGNRTKRVYFCNNGTDPYPSKKANQQKGITEEFQYVDALYPNPTSGKFSITFGKALNNADVFLIDINGKVIRQFKATGNKVDFDLSSASAGVYFVRIEDEGNTISKKVVKQ
jgi:hypothetical protein